MVSSKLEMQTVHALRPIPAGEQITVAYYGGDKPGHRDARRAVLKDQYGFECACPLCGLTGEARRASEARQHRIAAIHARLPSFPPELPSLVRRRGLEPCTFADLLC